MKTARSLIACFLAAACLFALSCGDEGDTPSAGCAQRDLDVCDETKAQCDLDAETADSPRAAREQCTADWCACIKAAGCTMEDYDVCTNR